MTTRLVTSIVIIATIVGLIAYDIWVVIEPTPGDTISAIVLNFAIRHPFASFAAGILCGHLFWPMQLHGKNVIPIPFSAVPMHWKTYATIALIVLICVAVLLLVLDVKGMLGVHPAIMLALGIPAGHWGWPQMKTKWREP
jgi:hypothetical protein